MFRTRLGEPADVHVEKKKRPDVAGRPKTTARSWKFPGATLFRESSFSHERVRHCGKRGRTWCAPGDRAVLGAGVARGTQIAGRRPVGQGAHSLLPVYRPQRFLRRAEPLNTNE